MKKTLSSLVVLFLLGLCLISCNTNEPASQFYTISYDTEYGYVPESKLLKCGSPLTEDYLPVLSADGYIFLGWDKTTENEITSDVKLTASWKWDEVLRIIYLQFIIVI